jgi:organic hydroperoxide reductase OsmC/OhrA
MNEGEFKTRIELVENYKLKVSFNSDKIEGIIVDEPEPLGSGEYPNAGRLLAAAVGSCLCASLAFCLRKSRAGATSISAEVLTTLERNDRGRLRVASMTVNLHPEVDDPSKLERCRSIFEDFCIVTESVRQGIEVKVDVKSPVSHS